MTKTELVAEIAARTGLKQSQVWQTLNSLCEVATERLQAGEDVALPPLGKFRYVVRAARQGRNPKTGETIEIPEKATVRFLPSSALKGRVN
ncbi:HU family DNA-binding protein [Alicyclobacillus acidocaldarius]|uniref:Viral histone-like protein n=1 Tax=Alicyclobacillus acidocaldarius (strain Tc-4-1) TaxID=1048834 RepID=F8IGL6_ALIAT|nr:HU family DNA-binding protein [Alicyclobacillus acidocaldarius]AEJ44296.1 histone family protein DNA-binding protein [Alicyclobacillus acidocaldarius subsp. acidocaldarius Tc-4-1]